MWFTLDIRRYMVKALLFIHLCLLTWLTSVNLNFKKLKKQNCKILKYYKRYAFSLQLK